MEDLYLDLVITTHGEYIILDEDELDEALQLKKITAEEYKTALDTKDFLLEKYKKKEELEKLYQFTMKYFSIMKEEEKKKMFGKL